MAKGWNFPSNNFGAISGIGEAGIETFKGSPYSSLAREICQNSLDAVWDKNKPVVIEFVNSFVNNSQIPSFTKLKEALYSALEFWSNQNNKKTTEFFKIATGVAESSEISILRISDYNTTGLTGSNKPYNTPWQNLVKAFGVSNKEGSSGGSFGIGKSAPFACSALRTVFYSTLDIDGLKAYQGIARLVSFPEKNALSNDGDRMTAGIGYYGETKKNSPIMELLTFDRHFKRDSTGTDVFIIGFMNKKGWENEIIKAVLDDFLLSVYKGYLTVKINNIEISQKTLPEMIERYKNEAKMAYNYYSVLVSPDTYAEEIDFGSLGNIELSILIRNNLHRKVYMSRSNGMKVFDQKNISSSIQFAGLCVLKDENINSFFREMENPQHNAWEPERHSNSKTAKTKKKELYRYIKSVVLDCGKIAPEDEIDAEGMGEFLPDEFTVDSGKDKRETATDTTKETRADASIQNDAQKGLEKLQSSTGPEDKDIKGSAYDISPGGLGYENSNDDKSNITQNENSFIDNKNYNSGKEGTGENRFDVVTSGKTDAAVVRGKFDISIVSVRLFSIYTTYTVNKKYRLIFTPAMSAPKGCIQLKLSGEQKSSDVNILSAAYAESDKLLKCKKNNIFLSDIQANKKISVDFSIDYAELCSMEVELYGYTI